MDQKHFIGYFCGFFDGEGNFSIRFRKDTRYNTGYNIDLRIQIQQKDPSVLFHIKETTKIGSITSRSNRDIYEWSVYNKEDLQKICSILSEGIIVKNKELCRFKEVLQKYKEKEHLSLKGIEKMKEIWMGDINPETEDNIG